MNSKAATHGSKLDIVKLVIAVLIVTTAVGAFYYYSDSSILVRVVGLLAATGIAIAIALQTDQGRQTWGFFKESQIEVRKVVWPTRQETVQTTLIVILMVVIVAVFMWVLDIFLAWGVHSLTGLGG